MSLVNIIIREVGEGVTWEVGEDVTCKFGECVIWKVSECGMGGGCVGLVSEVGV